MGDWNTYTFTIAGLMIRFETEQKLQLNESFLPFYQGKGAEKADYLVRFCEVPELKDFPEQWVYEGVSYTVADDGGGGYWRLFRDARRENKPYAVGKYDWKKRHLYVEYLPGSQKFISETSSCFFHIA